MKFFIFHSITGWESSEKEKKTIQPKLKRKSILMSVFQFFFFFMLKIEINIFIEMYFDVEDEEGGSYLGGAIAIPFRPIVNIEH